MEQSIEQSTALGRKDGITSPFLSSIFSIVKLPLLQLDMIN